jgi:hypothetical protein
MIKTLFISAGLLLSTFAFGQQFELPQVTGDEFEKVKVNVGGDFAIQYQILDHQADTALIPLGTGFNLPTANLNVGADLAKGISVSLETYLSSRHHNETWVKGGYLLIDELPFITSEGVGRIMDYLTIKVGVMELNYGDGHFRRTDNGKAIVNPFVGNYVMDAFTTAPAAEFMFRGESGLLLMAGLTTGSVRPDLTSYRNGTYTAYDAAKEIGLYWKAGFDKQFDDEVRARFTVSGYHMPAENHNSTIYGGDRAGSRYYLIMNRITNASTDVDIKANHLSGNFHPGTANKNNSFMFNLFAKTKMVELFGTYETAKGIYASGNEFQFSQFAVEGLLRFGGQQQFYGGARYNIVKGNTNTAVNNDQSVNRFQLGAGWFIIPSIILKLEYVDQNYVDFRQTYGEDAGFDGFMIEAAVSF